MSSSGDNRAYVYVRVSSNKTQQEMSDKDQTRRGKDYFAYRFKDTPVTWGGVVLDECSGSIPLFKRPNGMALWPKLRRGDHIIVSTLDRVFRSLADAVNTLEWLNKQGVALHMLDLNIDTASEWGQMMVQIIAMFAELERKRISRRRKDANRERRRRGLACGNHHAIGWMIDGKKGSKKLVPDTTDRATCRYIAVLREQERMSVEEIWRLFARSKPKITTSKGKEWSRNRILRGYKALKEGFPRYAHSEYRKELEGQWAEEGKKLTDV